MTGPYLPVYLTEAVCRPDQFTCGSGECLTADKVCDGRRECRDGSDERSCGKCLCVFVNRVVGCLVMHAQIWWCEDLMFELACGVLCSILN